MNKVEKGYLGFTEGMIIGSAMPKYEGGHREVNWTIVKEFIESNKENIGSVEVGLAEDWGYTSGEVWNSEDGYIPKENTYVYGSSSRATPSMEVSFKDSNVEMFECWKLGDNSGSYFE